MAVRSTTLFADFAPTEESSQSLTTTTRASPAARSRPPLQTWCDDFKACGPEGLNDSSGLGGDTELSFNTKAEAVVSLVPLSPGGVTWLVGRFPISGFQKYLAKSLFWWAVLVLASFRHAPFLSVSVLSGVGGNTLGKSLSETSVSDFDLVLPAISEKIQTGFEFDFNIPEGAESIG